MVKSKQRVRKLNRLKTKKRIHIGGTVNTHCDCDKCNVVRANSNAGIWLHTTKYIESIHKKNPEYFEGVDKQDILKPELQIMREAILAEIEDNIRSQIKAGEYKHSKFGNNAKTSTMNVINKMMAKIELLTKEMETANANKVNDYLTQISKLKTQLMRIGNDVTLFKEYVYDHEMLKLKPNTASKNDELMKLEAVLTKLRRFVIYGLHKFNSDDRTFIKYKNNNTHDETNAPYSFRYINIDEYKELMVDYIKSTTVPTSNSYMDRINEFLMRRGPRPEDCEVTIIPMYVYELTIEIFYHVYYTDDRIYTAKLHNNKIIQKAKAELPSIIAKINELTLKLKTYLWTYTSTDYIDDSEYDSNKLNNLREYENDSKAKIRQQAMIAIIARNHPLLRVKRIKLSHYMTQKPNGVIWFSNGGWTYYSKYDDSDHPYLNKTGPAKLNYVAKIRHPTNILSINTLDEFIKFTVEYGITRLYMRPIRNYSIYANEAYIPTDTSPYFRIDWDRVSNTYMGVAFNFHKAAYLPGYDNSKHKNYVAWYDTGDSYAIESLVIFNTFAFNNTVTLTTFKI